MAWSSRYSACIECGEVKRPHNARGLCLYCYKHAWKTNSLPEKEARWGPRTDCCRNCGTNEIPHQGLDLCQRCYEVKYRKENKGNMFFILKEKYKDMKRTTKRKNFNEIMTFEEFYDFSKNNKTFIKLMEVYYNSNYDYKLAPSIDRIDNNKGYIKGNIQFLTQSENASKGQTDVPQGKRIKLVKEGRELTFKSQHHAARFFNVTQSAIYSAIKNNRKLQGWTVVPIEAT